MNTATFHGCVAMIRADASLESRERTRLIAALKTGGTPPSDTTKPNGPRIYQRREAARLAGRSLRWVDSIARRGLVRRVKLPGNIRAVGIRADDLEKLIESATVAVEEGAAT